MLCKCQSYTVTDDMLLLTQASDCHSYSQGTRQLPVTSHHTHRSHLSTCQNQIFRLQVRGSPVCQSLTACVCTIGAWVDSTVEDVPDHAHLEDILLADTHPADTLQTPEEGLQVGARQGTPVGALAAAPDPFLGADPAPPCPPHAEEDLPAQMYQLQGDLTTVQQLLQVLSLCQNV